MSKTTKISNTTIFNTDDIMAYVNDFIGDSYQPDEVRIRYINNPRRVYEGYDNSKGRSTYTERWVRIIGLESQGTVEIKLLRLNKQMASESPLSSLARAASEANTAPDKLREDLVARLAHQTYGRTATNCSVQIPIRVANKADKVACRENALKNLRKKVKSKKGQVAWYKRDLIAQKAHLEHLKRALPKIENETIPGVEKELADMQELLKRREEEARGLGINI